MKYLIIKVKDNNIYSSGANYYVKSVNSGENAHKTLENDNFKILEMTEQNESGLVFLSENYFAIPNKIDKDLEQDNESDQEHDEEDKTVVFKGFTIHRLNDGS
jgi:hypothetical protein